MEDNLRPKGRAGWLGAVVGVTIPALLYCLFFFSLEHPPGSPPVGGDGDWAALGFVVGFPVLLVVMAVGGLVGCVVGRLLSKWARCGTRPPRDDIRTGVCPLCRHNEMLYSPSFSERAICHDAEPPRAYGLLSLYTCRSCGFSQWFARQPARVPIGNKRGIELIKGREPQGPYR